MRNTLPLIAAALLATLVGCDATTPTWPNFMGTADASPSDSPSKSPFDLFAFNRSEPMPSAASATSDADNDVPYEPTLRDAQEEYLRYYNQ